MAILITPNIKQLRVSVDGEKVLLIHNGTLLLELPYQAALEVSKVIRAQAKKAEENAKTDNVIMDQATLLRSGFPLNLTGNKDIKKEAIKEAQHNRDLRRFIPNSGMGKIKSQEKFGYPSLIKQPPKK